MGVPRVSVVIASYNRCEDLRLVLEAIQASAYPDLEIIVVDNASSDSAPLVAASFHGVRIIQNEDNRGFAEANNQGLALATGHYIALVNNDAVMALDWIQRLVDFLEAHPRTAAAGGKAYFWNADNPVGDSRNHYFSYTLVDADSGWNKAMVDTPDAVRRVATLSGCAVMIRRAAIESAGAPFLDPKFFTYYEETDFFARVIRHGWDLYYIPDAVVWHRVGAMAEAGKSYHYLYHMERNRILYAFRNFEGKALKRVEASLKRKIVRNAWRRLCAPLGTMNGERRARWDAWAWYRSRIQELVLERSRLIADGPTPYNAAVRALQSCAEPFLPLPEEEARELVSIVIANHNYGRFLRESIESALGQTYPRVEVILVDDGSTDDSLEVAKGYPVTLVPQRNQGVSVARNQGAAIAKGTYLVFLDADDMLEPEYVMRCLEALRGRPESVAYAYTGMRYFGMEDRVYCARPFEGKALLAGNFVHVSALVRRKAFDEVGGFDPDWRQGHEDYELWVRMLDRGFQGQLVPEPLLNYRRHGGGRNALSRPVYRELRWRLRFTYPKLYWPKLLVDPIRTTGYLFHFRGFLSPRRGGPS